MLGLFLMQMYDDNSKCQRKQAISLPASLAHLKYHRNKYYISDSSIYHHLHKATSYDLRESLSQNKININRRYACRNIHLRLWIGRFATFFEYHHISRPAGGRGGGLLIKQFPRPEFWGGISHMYLYQFGLLSVISCSVIIDCHSQIKITKYNVTIYYGSFET